MSKTLYKFQYRKKVDVNKNITHTVYTESLGVKEYAGKWAVVPHDFSVEYLYLIRKTDVDEFDKVSLCMYSFCPDRTEFLARLKQYELENIAHFERIIKDCKEIIKMCEDYRNGVNGL